MSAACVSRGVYLHVLCCEKSSSPSHKLSSHTVTINSFPLLYYYSIFCLSKYHTCSNTEVYVMLFEKSFFVCHCAGCLLINSSSMCTSCFIHFTIFICSAGLAFHVMELSILYFVLMNAMICRQV